MKRLFLVAAAAFVAWSCNTADVNDMTPSTKMEAREVSFNVSMASAGDTRIALSESEAGNLVTSWVDGETLGGFVAGKWQFAAFKMVDGSMSADGKSATFTGTTDALSLRLVHPYDAYNYIFNNKIYATFIEQNVDMAQDAAAAIVGRTYMISEEIMADGSEAPHMKHVAAAGKVNMKFENLPAEDLKLQSVELKGADGLEIPNGANIDLSLAVDDDAFFVFDHTGEIKSVISNSPVIAAGETYSYIVSLIPFKIAVGQSLEAKVVLANDDYSYTKTFKISPEADYDIARASYASFNYNCDMTDAETRSLNALKVGEPKASAFMINFDVEVDLESCDGYAYTSYQTEYASSYAGYFESDLRGGYATYVNESGVLSFGSDNFLQPGMSYTVEIAAYVDNGDHTFSIVGNKYVTEVSTTAPIIGASDAEITFEVDDAKTSLTGFGGTIYNNDDVSGYYCGNVADADAADGAQAWVESTGWLTGGTSYAVKFAMYDWMSGGLLDSPTKEFIASSKSAGTEYTVFVIPIDNEGFLGKFCESKVTTSSLNIDPSIKPIVEVTPDFKKADFSFDFNGCHKVMRMNCEGTQDSAYAQSTFYGDLTQMYYGWTVGDEEVVDGKASYTVENLAMGTEYNMYYLGIAEDGTMGEIQVLKYSTGAPAFGETEASINVTINPDKSQAYYRYDPAVYTDPMYLNYVYAKVTFDLEFTGGTTSYLWGVFDDTYVLNKVSMAAYGTYLIGSYYNTKEGTELTISDTEFSGKSYVLVIVPKEGDLLGTPQVIKYDGWDNLIFGEKEDGGVDEGGTVR